MSNEDFWNSLVFGQRHKSAASVDNYLSSNAADKSVGLRALTDRGRESNALHLPAIAGTRVAFVTNIGSVLSYPTLPEQDATGNVVMVRTAEGDQTSLGGMVFVKFDDGNFMQIHPEHLKLASSSSKQANSFVQRCGSLGDLTGFLRSSRDDSQLIHKATQDLWSFEQTDEGDFLISRLFDDSGDPLKV